MSGRVLVLGGCGRVGAAVAADLVANTDARVTVTGRGQYAAAQVGEQRQPLTLELDDLAGLRRAILTHDLVVDCAGPFSRRDDRVLRLCIQEGVDYLDVADNPVFVRRALELRDYAAAAGVTAVVASGVFPGISNSMARQGIERLDRADDLRISYVIGAGGVGPALDRFLELRYPFPAWIDGKWQTVRPYSRREKVRFPAPFGRCGVYWHSTIAAATLPLSFPLRSVVTKVGALPGFLNEISWLMAAWAPKHPRIRDDSADIVTNVGIRIAGLTDRLSRAGIAMRLDIDGERAGRPVVYTATLLHSNTAIAAGHGAGAVAQLLLGGELRKPGVWAVEQALPTPLFEREMQRRKIEIQQTVG